MSFSLLNIFIFFQVIQILQLLQGQVLEIYFVPFVGPCLPVCFFELCIGICTIESTATSPSLYRLPSCRGRPSPVSSVRDSGILSNLFCECISFGFVAIILSQGGFAHFFLEHVSSSSLWCLSVVLQVPRAAADYSVVLFFFPATPRHLDYVRPCQCFEIGDTETSVLGSSLINWNIGHMLQLFPSSGRSQELGFSCHSFCTELEVETMASMCYSSNHCLCFRRHPAWYSYSSVLRFRQERNLSL